MAIPKILFKGMLPPGWGAIPRSRFAAHGFEAVLADRDPYAPDEIFYFSGFRPPPGFLGTLPNLKAIFSLGAGVDGFLRDPDFPRALPLVRFVDPTLIHEMAQYVVMQVLIAHRGQRFFDAAQRETAWRQRMLLRPSRDTRIGIMGMGDIGTAIAHSLMPFDFALHGWSASRKSIPGVTSYAGADELAEFLSQSDYLVCVLPLTDATRGILNAELFAKLPRGAVVMNVARGGHLVDEDLVAALDSGICRARCWMYSRRSLCLLKSAMDPPRHHRNAAYRCAHRHAGGIGIPGRLREPRASGPALGACGGYRARLLKRGRPKPPQFS